MPNDLGPERLTLRQADQAREDLAQILDEYDFKHLNSVLASNVDLRSASKPPDNPIKSSANRREKCVEELCQPGAQSCGGFGFYRFDAKHFRDQCGDAVLGHFVGRDVVGISRPWTKAVGAQQLIEVAARCEIFVL